MELNKLTMIKNQYQGDRKKVLCVCLAGLLRSPTAAWVFSNPPYNYNTRSCGMEKGCSLIPLTEELVEWADEIVVMDGYQKLKIVKMNPNKKIINLNIGDNYEYKNPELIKLIKKRYRSRSVDDKN